MKVEVVKKLISPKYSELVKQILSLEDDKALRITDITKKEANAIRQTLWRSVDARCRVVKENSEVVLYLYKKSKKGEGKWQTL